MANFRSQTTTNTGTSIKTSGADVVTINITNRHSAAIFVKFYDQTVATFQDTPYRIFQIAANAQITILRNESALSIFSTSNGLCVRVVTDNTDAGNTAAATLPIIEIQYN
jgi:hypothetical protein